MKQDLKSYRLKGLSSALFSALEGSCWINTDGTFFYQMVISSNQVKKFSFGDIWDASSINTTPIATLVVSSPLSARSMTLNPSETKLNVLSIDNSLPTGGTFVQEYTLSTPGDLTTGSLTNTLDITIHNPEAKGWSFYSFIKFNFDGSYMYVSYADTYIGVFSLGTPYDTSTATFVINIDFSSFLTNEIVGFDIINNDLDASKPVSFYINDGSQVSVLIEIKKFYASDFELNSLSFIQNRVISNGLSNQANRCDLFIQKSNSNKNFYLFRGANSASNVALWQYTLDGWFNFF